MTQRCEEVIVQFIVRTYDDQNRPVHQEETQPVRVFRYADAKTEDFWALVDAVVEARAKK